MHTHTHTKASLAPPSTSLVSSPPYIYYYYYYDLFDCWHATFAFVRQNCRRTCTQHFRTSLPLHQAEIPLTFSPSPCPSPSLSLSLSLSLSRSFSLSFARALSLALSLFFPQYIHTYIHSTYIQTNTQACSYFCKDSAALKGFWLRSAVNPASVSSI